MTSRQSQNLERVFVDESGGTDLPPESQGVPDVYVTAGIYFPETDYIRYSKAAEMIVREFAGSGELKSSRIGSKTARRAEILLKIAENRLPFYCLVVDKTIIWRGIEGVRYFLGRLGKLLESPSRPHCYILLPGPSPKPMIHAPSPSRPSTPLPSIPVLPISSIIL